jgi:hypothetical protein
MQFRRHRREHDLDEEIRFHIDTEADQRMRDGLSEHEARLAARRAFGSVELSKEITRQMWTWSFLTRIGQDVRYAFRALRRAPAFAAAAILSLSLGIGVNSAIFSVFDRLILRKLPVASPEQIVVLNSPGRKPGSTSAGDSGGSTQVFSYPLFRDLERLQTKRLSGIAAHRDFDANLAFDGHTTRADGLLVSGSYFPVLRVSPALGRLLTVDDDRALGANPVVVLSHRYWTTRFASDPAVIGKALTVNGESLTIVGVAPEGFSGTTTMDYPDVFVPLTMTERVHGD